MKRLSNVYLSLAVRARNLRQNVQGQDLIEYALLVTLISLAVTAAMNGIASALSKVFNNASSSLS